MVLKWLVWVDFETYELITKENLYFPLQSTTRLDKKGFWLNRNKQHYLLQSLIRICFALCHSGEIVEDYIKTRVTSSTTFISSLEKYIKHKQIKSILIQLKLS